jgi:hypothetical protein
MTAPLDGDQNAVLLHQFRNKLSIIVGFCDLLLNDLPAADPKKAEVTEIRRAGLAAIALLPELSSRMK